MRLFAALISAAAWASGGTFAAAETDRLTIAVGVADAGAASAGDLAFHGFERELAEALCRRMATGCDILDIDRDEVIPRILAGEADAGLAALADTTALREAVGVTLPYAVPRHGFAIPRARKIFELPGTGTTPSVAVTPKLAQDAIDELRQAFDGRSIGAKAGSADFDFLTLYFAAVASVHSYPSTDAAFAAMLQGRLDAVMAPITDFAVSGERPGFQTLVRSGPEFGEDELFGQGIAVALPKSDADLRGRLNRAIDGMIGDGSLRALSLRWFAVDITPRQCACKPF